jgi:hypothetical protein
LKKLAVITLLLLFAASNLLMPYANFDDTHSLSMVYNTCLAGDADMNLAEFVGEKFLGLGFEGDEEEESNLPEKTIPPTNKGEIIQIQSGAMYQEPLISYTTLTIPLVRIIIPLINSGVPSTEFHPAIFHPPIEAAA